MPKPQLVSLASEHSVNSPKPQIVFFASFLKDGKQAAALGYKNPESVKFFGALEFFVETAGRQGFILQDRGKNPWLAGVSQREQSSTHELQNHYWAGVSADLSNWNTPYTFSGKEKDTETGYSYPSTGSGRRFGARYYDSDISVWLSVDPMADKYPSMSSYMYTAGNPVMLVDPDGRSALKPNNLLIPSIIEAKYFVGWQEHGDPFFDRFYAKNKRAPECLDYAKEQMRVVGTTAGGAKTSTNMYLYDEKKGANSEMADKAVSYMTETLDKGLPILVGVDLIEGAQINEGTTDHFIVVVGYQENDDGTVSFRFFDNASGDTKQGSNPNNILTYDPQTGKIKGQSQTHYGQSHDEYTVSQVRVTETTTDP
jgi:RHS repeat-associated protein